jgi:hypothetical protein
MKEFDMSNDNKYIRTPFEVEAERVTPLNIHRLAKWCGGKVYDDGVKEGNFSRDYIKVNINPKPTNPDHEQAKIGDWVVKSGRTWKVYGDKAFRRSFQRQDGSPIGFTEIETEDTPKIKKKAPVPTAPKQTDRFDHLDRVTEEFQAREAQKQLAGEAGPEIVKNSDGTILVGDQLFQPATPVPLATSTPTDMGSNVEIPNADGSITVVPTPDPQVVVDQNAKQVDPTIPDTAAVPEQDITVDQQLVLEGNAQAIVEGEANRSLTRGTAESADAFLQRQEEQTTWPAEDFTVPVPTDIEEYKIFRDKVLRGEVVVTRSMNEEMHRMDRAIAVTPPNMTEVVPGVEVSDGPVSLKTTTELVENPQDVVNSDGQTPGERFRGEG